MKITRIIGKALLGLLIVLLVIIALIHLPSVQNQITHKISTYLSSKIESKVEINKIEFSILGYVAIEGLTVWDKGDHKIFSAQKIAASSSLLDLLAGDLIFDEVSISGADGHLIQAHDGLNIQYIIDAFQSAEKDTTAATQAVTLKFKNVRVENIQFEFSSTINGVSVSVILGKFFTENLEFSTLPLMIKADQVTLQHTIINTLLTTGTDTLQNRSASTDPILLYPDFGTGINFEIKKITLSDNEATLHKNEVRETQSFDPSHLSLKNIHLGLADIIIHEDTLSAFLQSASVQLPGFTLHDASSTLQLNRNELHLSGLRLVSGNNEFAADLIVPNNIKIAKATDHNPIDVTLQCRIHPNDFAYFFTDSMMNIFNHWSALEVKVDGNYVSGKGYLKNLSVKTGNSQILAYGQVNNVFDLNKISWNNLAVNTTIGSDFQRIITPLLKERSIPAIINLQLKSSGDLSKLKADGKAYTSWGDAMIIGQASRQGDNIAFEIKADGNEVNLGKWLDIPAFGNIDLTASAKGWVDSKLHLDVNGLIKQVEILNQKIRDIDFESSLREDSALVAIAINDPDYSAEINSELAFEGRLRLTNSIQLDSFKLGRLFKLDSTLSISGVTKSNVLIDSSILEGAVTSNSILFQWQSQHYLLDTMSFHAKVSPTESDIEYYTENQHGNLASNFDIREFPKIIKTWSTNVFKSTSSTPHPLQNRSANFNIELETPIFFKLFGIEVDDFSSLRLQGEFDEQKQLTTLHAASENFKGYGISLDTLKTIIAANQDSISANMNINNLFYNSLALGKLDFDLLKKENSAISNLSLANDSITLLDLRARLFDTDSGAFIYPEKLKAFDTEFEIEAGSAVVFTDHNILSKQFVIHHDSTRIKLDGDINDFDVSLRYVDLTPLNLLLSKDTAVINKGHLNGTISYSRGQQLNLQATIDSLSLYNSNPLTVTARAVSNQNELPFEFLIKNESNNIGLKGKYFSASREVDASLRVDVNNLELFTFLVSGFIDDMKGTIQGETSIKGPIQKPEINGYLQFVDVRLTTVNPKLSFNVKDDRITMDNTTLRFNRFTLYDQELHPLIIDGKISSEDYRSITYDLQINSAQYALINHPDSTSGKMRGSLVLDSDIKLTGNEKDTRIKAKLTIKNETDLTLVTSNDEIELLKAEGIVDFIDPSLLLDSAAQVTSASYYDSLLASLPDFNLSSTITIENNAVFRVLIDEQSGDYMETSGGANLEMSYDRTGNLQLNGNYTVQKGVYRLSFYDLVKKNFSLVQGSSITWNGNPKNGDLNIKAVHTVKSNSIGLIGHEIGENEKSIYQRSLDYEVGINIKGTIERPVISFSLDLPQNERVNYPVLANKLDRLHQPEYESELNKQVFGLLVLGGFLPETSGSDINSSLIATTALSNSVNSLLASQLNRFASQYVKGVNIDVGIQSFSDYSAPGGKTQTAMDFRVSKRMMNDRLSFEIGGDFNISQDQSGANTGTKNYRGDIAIIYDLTGNGDKKLKLFNNETYDIVYQEIRNTGISLIFIREFENRNKTRNKDK